MKMKKTSNKIALIGAGAVGTSFLANIKATEDYSELKDADIVVITAGRPQLPGETRLNMVAGNAKIMRDIANNVKASGFDGITIIAANPVDVLTLVYQEITGFDAHKVIGSGTTLDSARLRRLTGEKLGVNAACVNAFLMGEHGDSSVAIWSRASIFDKPIMEYVKEGKLQEAELSTIRDEAVNMAYKIIDLKRATFYGIGAALTRIAKAVLNDERATLMVGAKLDGEYNNKGIYTGVPAIISRNGWDSIIEWTITDEEQKLFDKSCETLLATVAKAREALDEK